jgi:hypothetical protein
MDQQMEVFYQCYSQAVWRVIVKVDSDTILMITIQLKDLIQQPVMIYLDVNSRRPRTERKSI